MTNRLDRKVQEQEGNVDAAVTKVQGWLEQLKSLHHTAWVVLIFGVAMLIAGIWIWLV